MEGDLHHALHCHLGVMWKLVGYECTVTTTWNIVIDPGYCARRVEQGLAMRCEENKTEQVSRWGVEEISTVLLKKNIKKQI